MTCFDKLPKEITSLNQWVCADGGSKQPMCATAPIPASSTCKSTWDSFETAKLAVNSGYYDYVGFVFNDNGIVGIDIDDGYDDEGFLSPLAADIINACKSYTEHSKSGRGFHILLKGDLPFTGRNNRAGVEIYKTARYFIMTGRTLLYDKIISSQDAIDYIVDKYFPEMRESENKCFSPKIYTPVWDKVIEGMRIKLTPTYPPIKEGSRNICLTSLAGTLHSQGYPTETIYNELIACNEIACKPMLHKNEIVAIVSSVTKYKR